MKFIKETKSICPEDFRGLPAKLFEVDGKVIIKKECPEHGEFEDVYWSDYSQYMRFQEQADKYLPNSAKMDNPRTETVDGCPNDCGICPEHKSSTLLAIVDVTNRCNLRCPICFAYAGAAGYVYEPTREQIHEMLLNLRRNSPYPAPALQFSGGEPTIRDDLPELVRDAKMLGFRHIEVNTNGIRIANPKDTYNLGGVGYVRELIDAGVSSFYLQFDAINNEPYRITRGVDNFWHIKQKAVENMRKAREDNAVAVVTLVKGVNDYQLGDMFKWLLENGDVFKCMNIQPVSCSGRIDSSRRKEMRITIPDTIRLLEEQTGGIIKREDFHTIATINPLVRFLRAPYGFTKHRPPDFSNHPHCGALALYFKNPDGSVTSLSEEANVEGFMDRISQANKELEKGAKISKLKAVIKALPALPNIKSRRIFSQVSKALIDKFEGGSYDALGDTMRMAMMVGIMHFMDPYNFDLERVQRCNIHYAIPDGRIIPFCTYNNLGYRGKIEKKFSVPIGKYKAN